MNSSEFKALFSPAVVELRSLFQKYGYDIRLAGGPVRDLLLGHQPTDLDFATTATPEQMKAMFEQENVRMINRNGEAHGTITVRILDDTSAAENFEAEFAIIYCVRLGKLDFRHYGLSIMLSFIK